MITNFEEVLRYRLYIIRRYGSILVAVVYEVNVVPVMPSSLYLRSVPPEHGTQVIIVIYI